MSITSFRIAKIKKIPIYVNVTFFLTFFLAMFIFIRMTYPFGFAEVESVYIKYGFSFVATFLFFALLLVHELAHSIVALGYGINIKNITLFFFGGVSVFEEMPKKPSQELLVAIAGPLSSIISGFLLIGIYLSITLISGYDTLFAFAEHILYKKDLGTLFLSVGSLTVLLGVFNMMPIFPLDGGRVLRAFIATFTPYKKATEQAAKIGQLFAILMAFFGLFFNIWLTILALFLYMSAGAESKRVTETSLLENVYTEDIMTKDIITVDYKMNLNDFLNFVVEHRHPAFPVSDNESIIGIVSINHLQKVSEAEQYALTVSDVMETDFPRVSPKTPAYETLRIIGGSVLGRALVFDEYRSLIGMVTKSDYMLYFSVKELKEENKVEIEEEKDDYDYF